MPRSAFVVALCVLGLTFVVAVAAEGVLDYLPPQRYFAPTLRESGVACAIDGPRWPINGTSSWTNAPSRAISDFEADWYGWQLRAARERSLYDASLDPASKSNQTVRFTWLRSFHAPVFVRIDEQPQGKLKLSAKRLSGRGGYSPGRLSDHLVRQLTDDEAARFHRALASGRVLELAPIGCEIGSDGANWIIEANDHGQYRYVNRWSPDNGPVHDLGRLMLGFTGWRLEPLY